MVSNQPWFDANHSIIDMENQEDMMTFSRIDAREDFVDHHIARHQAENAGLITYLSVTDFDDIQAGHYWLKSKGYKHAWGVGQLCTGAKYLIIGGIHGAGSMNIGRTPISLTMPIK